MPIRVSGCQIAHMHADKEGRPTGISCGPSCSDSCGLTLLATCCCRSAVSCAGAGGGDGAASAGEESISEGGCCCRPFACSSQRDVDVVPDSKWHES